MAIGRRERLLQRRCGPHKRVAIAGAGDPSMVRFQASNAGSVFVTGLRARSLSAMS